MKKPLPARWMITDSKQFDPVAAAKNLPQNSGIILRDYDLDSTKRFALAIALKKICYEKNLPLLIANDVKLALKIKADGVHFPQYAAADIRRWRIKKPNWIILSATHSRAAAKFAHTQGADAVLISPVFPSKSHPGQKSLGIMPSHNYIYRGLCAYALGGVQLHHEKLLRMADFKGFAGISWVKNCVAGATVAPRTAKK